MKQIKARRLVSLLGLTCCQRSPNLTEDRRDVRCFRKDFDKSNNATRPGLVTCTVEARLGRTARPSLVFNPRFASPAAPNRRIALLQCDVSEPSRILSVPDRVLFEAWDELFTQREAILCPELLLSLPNRGSEVDIVSGASTISNPSSSSDSVCDDDERDRETPPAGDAAGPSAPLTLRVGCRGGLPTKGDDTSCNDTRTVAGGASGPRENSERDDDGEEDSSLAINGFEHPPGYLDIAPSAPSKLQPGWRLVVSAANPSGGSRSPYLQWSTLSARKSFGSATQQSRS